MRFSHDRLPSVRIEPNLSIETDEQSDRMGWLAGSSVQQRLAPDNRVLRRPADSISPLRLHADCFSQDDHDANRYASRPDVLGPHPWDGHGVRDLRDLGGV